jgi:hypothetical protein
MADFANDPGHSSELSPLNLADLRLRLIRGTPGHATTHADVIKELIALGEGASVLLPQVVDQYQAGKLQGVPASLLVELYLQSRHHPLLDALRQNGVFGGLSTFEKCSLLEAGVSELEDDLLAYLWQAWATAGDLNRVPIVKSLAQAGGPKAQQMLEVIRYKMAGQVQEEIAKLGSLDLGNLADKLRADTEPTLRKLDAGALQDFLQEVRSALQQMTKRGIK